MPHQLLSHGGRLNDAAQKFEIPVSDWLDLSTGINPNGWPVKDVPADVWRRLPEEDDGLEAAAKRYYGCDSLLAAPGTQSLIQCLPEVRLASFGPSRVAVPSLGYEEHRHGWERSGHHIQFYQEQEFNQLSDKINSGEIDVVVVINPNNPTTTLIPRSVLLEWHELLAEKGGWLIVDEAFLDSTTDQSVLSDSPRPGLIVFRSAGKFFGLAGIRLGFIFAEKELLDEVKYQLGPWTVSGPARWQGRHALIDIPWQREAAVQLTLESEKLQALLSKSLVEEKELRSTNLFISVFLSQEKAREIYHSLAQQGILIRLFNRGLASGDGLSCLRFGLPGSEAGLLRLEEALSNRARCRG